MSWQIENKKLVKEFSFKNQTELVVFFTKIAEHADQVQHHPDVTVYKCSRMKIELCTHDQNAITEKDYALADFIDSL